MPKKKKKSTGVALEATPRAVAVVSLGTAPSFDVLDAILKAGSPALAAKKMPDIASALANSQDNAPAELVLVIMPTPANTLARALAGGVKPEEAAVAWTRDAEALLSDVGAHWHRVLFLDEEALCHAPDLLEDDLGRRLGSSLENTIEFAAPQKASDSDIDLYFLLARQLLKQDASALRLSGQIGAITLGSDWTEGPEVAQLERICATLHARQETLLKNEALLRDKVLEKTSLEKEATALRSNITELRAQVEQDRSDAVSAQDQQAEQSVEISALKEENTTLKETIAAQNSRLEKNSQAAAQAASRATKLQSEALAEGRALKDECHHLRMTLSELRHQIEQDGLDIILEREINLSGKKKEAATRASGLRRDSVLGAGILQVGQERDALLKSLATANDELRKLAFQIAEAQDAQAVSAAQITERDKTLSRLRDDYQKLGNRLEEEKTAGIARIGELDKALGEVRDELTRVYNSKSWKAVSVMRAARHSVKK